MVETRGGDEQRRAETRENRPVGKAGPRPSRGDMRSHGRMGVRKTESPGKYWRRWSVRWFRSTPVSRNRVVTGPPPPLVPQLVHYRRYAEGDLCRCPQWGCPLLGGHMLAETAARGSADSR